MDLKNRKLEFGPKNGMMRACLGNGMTLSAARRDDIGMGAADDKNTAST